MSVKARLFVVLGLSLAGCTPSRDTPDRAQETQAAEPRTAAPRGDTAGMAGMAGMSGTPSMPADSGAMPPMAGLDHAPTTSTMPGMDHGAMTGMQMASSELDRPGSDPLLTLVSELVKDPIVLHEIDADPTLREVWADTSVTRIILRPR